MIDLKINLHIHNEKKHCRKVNHKTSEYRKTRPAFYNKSGFCMSEEKNM